MHILNFVDFVECMFITHGIYHADFKKMVHKQYLAGEAPES
jgi:hypothetical protein